MSNAELSKRQTHWLGNDGHSAPKLWRPLVNSNWTLDGLTIGRGEIIGFLLLACLAQMVLMWGLENAFSIKDHFTVYKMPSSFYEQAWWKYLLPQEEIFGTWTSTTVVFAALAQQDIHPAIVLLFCHCVLILTGFFVSLGITNSIVFSATAAILFVTVPFNYHVYSVHGTTAQALLLSYFLMTVHAIILLVDKVSVSRWIYLVLSAFLFVLGYETWLDTAVVLAIVTPILFFIFSKRGDLELRRRVVFVLFSVICVVILYVTIKVSLGFGSGKGSETDLLLHYPSIGPMIDDFLVKVVSFSFTATSLVLPSSMTGSLSMPMYGADWIIDQQHGYHSAMQFLTYMNHIFLWRIHAGAYFVALLCLGAWAALRLSRGHGSWRTWMLLVCVTMLLFGAATHSLVKYRPMHTMPYMGYQVWVNVLGAIGIICVAIDALVAWVGPQRQRLVILLCWSGLVFVGFSVRANLKFEAAAMAMGAYPDPL